MVLIMLKDLQEKIEDAILKYRDLGDASANIIQTFSEHVEDVAEPEPRPDIVFFTGDYGYTRGYKDTIKAILDSLKEGE